MGDFPSVPLRLLTVRVPTRSKPATAWETPRPRKERLKGDRLVDAYCYYTVCDGTAKRLKKMPFRG